MGKKEKNAKKGRWIFLLVGIVLGIAMVTGLSFKFGWFGTGAGTGISTNVSHSIQSPSIEPHIKYSFYFDQDQIYFHNQLIDWKKFQEILRTASQENLPVELTFEETTVTSGFQRKVENLVRQLGLSVRHAVSTRKNSSQK